MKEITREVVQKVIDCYEAEDGTRFKTKEECQNYEESSEYAVWKQFRQLMVRSGHDDNGIFAECQIWENFGYGSEEYDMAVLDIQTPDDLKIVDMFVKECCEKFQAENWQGVNKKYIGKKILVSLGYACDKKKTLYVRGTLDELVKQFKEETGRFFEEEKGEEHEEIK